MFIAVGADVPLVTSPTIQTAEPAFPFVNNGSGYNQAVWLITQLGLAAGEKDPLKSLRSQEIDIPDNTSLPGVAPRSRRRWTTTPQKCPSDRTRTSRDLNHA